jgi:hypothetical protein
MRFRIGPILRNAGPLGAQAFLIGIGILDDKRLQPLRMRRDDAKADRPAIVMKEEGVFVDLELLEKAVDRLGQIVKGVRIRRRRRSVTLTESWKIRCYQVIACCEQGMSVSNSREEEGNPCSSTIVGASFGPASR